MADLLERLKAALADRYRIERELGRGGMATVYLAEDLKHHRPVALKVLRPELAAALGTDRFLREIEISARLTHPHILPLLDSGEADGSLFYVMPYVEGESLRDRLSRERQLPVDDALQVSREVADALSYAHAHGVVHRDIKPENILIESGHAVVADFGIAKAIAAAGDERLTEEERLTGTGVALGTPMYMSPEQVTGGQDLDGRSDLYSLGCVLFEMLAGQPPFLGTASIGSLVQQHLTADPPKISNIRPAVPSHVAAALERALAKMPADRFHAAAAFAAALGPQGATASQPTSAKPWTRIRRALVGAVAVIVVAAAVIVGRRLTSFSSVSGYPRTAIAVLPFQNLSAEGPYAYFAGGLQGELITQLAKVAALKPISRTSVMEYAERTKSLKQIADELAVGTIIEASVQVVDDRLRVNVQLIDAATDQHLWAERYDRDLDDVLTVQSDVAQRIVAAVGATLAETERTAIAVVPTANAEAYRLYLQGDEYARRPGRLRNNWEIAQHFFEQAVALDSGFALAHAALSRVHGSMWWFRYDPSEERLVRQREEAELALRLAPDLPQAHLALGGVYYRAQWDWQAALREFQIAGEHLPNDANVWLWIGFTQRRLGNWGEVLSALERVTVLDPRNAQALGDLGGHTLKFLHRYREAVEWYGRAAALQPDVVAWDVERAWTWVLWQGRTDSLEAALDRHPAQGSRGGGPGPTGEWRARLVLWKREPDSVLALLRQTPDAVYDAQVFYLPTALYAAWAHQLRRDGAAARAAFDSAVVLLDSAVVALPDDWRLHAARGLALAGLGRRQEARREAQWLQQSTVYRDDALWRSRLGMERARILAEIGDTDPALQEIERLLTGPSELSVHALRLDPWWDPIRDDPRFQVLLEKYDPPKPVPLD